MVRRRESRNLSDGECSSCQLQACMGGPNIREVATRCSERRLSIEVAEWGNGKREGADARWFAGARVVT